MNISIFSPFNLIDLLLKKYFQLDLLIEFKYIFFTDPSAEEILL
jgi:hypothetical protein